MVLLRKSIPQKTNLQTAAELGVIFLGLPMDIFAILIPIAVVLFILFSIFTKRGKGFLFNGRITKTIEGKIKETGGLNNISIHVHVIESSSESEAGVGLEIHQSAILGWSVTPINLSKTNAKQLISMLQQAVK